MQEPAHARRAGDARCDRALGRGRRAAENPDDDAGRMRELRAAMECPTARRRRLVRARTTEREGRDLVLPRPRPRPRRAWAQRLPLTVGKTLRLLFVAGLV